MPSPRLRCLVALVSLALAAHCAAQDSSTAAIRGTVMDTTGARIAGAAVTAERAGAGVARSLKTDSNGSFNFGFLPPGDYTIRVDAPQMASETRTGVAA